ncbi:LOW QUALITY PROTEIN: interleukin-23 receptor [Sceloporus undulatus]|uniref:LOW QUALITY PROTEIN: interleukin-23 receptor n=1 Tax=Sceloporus undulatus TaxID=8520 RepID=UPI001C4AC282|nr:LOW QUALITY PROTEIN: interleukin-23 receptor [Sceloporus undulatus]
MMVVTAKILMVFYVLSCKVHQVLLSNRCSDTSSGFIICSGHVWTEPASLIQMGQNISINCHADKEFCQNGSLYFVLNNVPVRDQLLTAINKTTIQLQLHDYQHPFSTVRCIVDCPQKPKNIICGTQFCLGYLPDRPANLTCVIHEYSDNMMCSWDSGKDTHLNTNYNLYVKSLLTEENKMFSANVTSAIIPLSQLLENQQFSVLVHAENDLGTVHSDPLHVDLSDIVIPANPVVIQNITVESPVFKTIIQWEKKTAINGTYCEERYKEATSETWHVRKWDSDFETEHHSEYNLEAITMYEFQVRCKLIHARAFWSSWSESTMYMTPEAEPSSVLDVWRYLGPTYQNGSQEVTILIKPFLPKESRGRILGYRVYCEKEGDIVELCKTTETTCKVLIPPAVSVVYVAAHNSKGSSKPANITVKHQHHDDLFPPPTKFQVTDDDQKGFFVRWEPPKIYGKAVLWYVVEWTSVVISHYHHGIMWRKVPSQNKTTYIEEHLRIKRNSNISVYSVYQDGTSRACSVQILEKNVQDRHVEKDPRSSSAATNGMKYGNDYDVGVMAGTGFGATVLSIFILTLIAKKSYRKRITTMLSSVTPKWVFEDYPKLQNSSVVKSLQEENDSVTQISTELFSGYEDSVITEVEEILVHKEYKAQDGRKETKEAVLQKPDLPERILSVSNSDVIEANGYKPQVSNKALLGNILTCTNEIHCPNPDAISNSPTLPMNSSIKDYMSPMVTKWPDENTLLFEKISLVLNSGGSGQSNVFSPADEEPNTPTAEQWSFLLSDDNVQEQTLIPEELLSCLKVVDNDSTCTVMPYFPQSMAK